MDQLFTQFAAEKAGLFESIGIDWKLLVLQTIAFLLLLWILKRFVYPPLVAMLDRSEDKAKAAEKAATEAEKKANNSLQQVGEMLTKARAEANDIVEAAREQAADVADEATKRATEKADALVKQAHDDITKEVEAAKKSLYNETLDLVADATGTVLREKVDQKRDETLIERAVKGAK